METEARSKKAICTADLRRKILTQVLEPGAYLDGTELGEAYGISGPPLREVLRQLQEEGYVALHENRGAQVFPMTHKTLRNFFLAAPMFYAGVTRLAALFHTLGQLQKLRECQWAFHRTIRQGDAAERAVGNERFHAIIGEMADNEFLMPSLRRLLIDQSRIGMTFCDPRKAEMACVSAEAADQYDRFIELIEARDADAAAELAVAHWELSRAQIESFVTPIGMNIPLGCGPGVVCPVDAGAAGEGVACPRTDQRPHASDGRHCGDPAGRASHDG